MNNSTAKVGEIFREAGSAFSKLSEMILQHPKADPPQGSKWTQDEIKMLRSCVHQFAVDLNVLSEHIKNRTVSQIRTTLKKKAFEDAGIPAHQVSSTRVSLRPLPKPQVVSTHSVISQQSIIRKNAEVTLNVLNASQKEEDSEELSNEIKMEYDSSSDDLSA